MKKTVFERRVRCLAGLFIVVLAGTAAAVYIVTESLQAAGIAFGGCVILCLLARLLYRLDDCYITGVVRDLSSLMDVLMELEEREIFPGNEDTVVSKLQSKVVKMVRILKNKNKAEEQEHENIKQLVSDLSHQLKTPLSNLTMYSQFLKDESLPEEKRREYVNVICMSIRRLNFLSENMIKISRLESGLIHLQMNRQSLNETLLKALKDIYPKAKERKIEIEYREQGQIMVCHDRNWTLEAVFNLLDNAVKYASQGCKVILSVRMLGMFAEVSVEDENGAIPKKEQAKIFTRFYRGSNSREREGIGIGLYLAREIAVRQGGYISLKTTEKGNIFCMFLYISSASDPRH